MIGLFVQSLALARLLQLFVNDDGPFHILKKFRQVIGIDEFGEVKNDLAELFTCHWCLGIWLSPIVYFGFQYIPWAIWILAIAEGGSLIYALIEKLEYGG